MLDVSPERIVDAHGLAHRVCSGPDVFDFAAEHQALDFKLDLIIELVTVGPEELDTIVIIWIMRRGDDNSRIRSQAAGDISHSGGWQRANKQNVYPHGQDTG